MKGGPREAGITGLAGARTTDFVAGFSMALLTTGNTGGVALTMLINPSNAPWKAQRGE